MTGIELSKLLGDIVLRSEVALYKGKNYNATDYFSEDIYEKDTYSGVIGLDWYPGNNWSAILQYADTFIADYDTAINVAEHTSLLTLSISKKVLHETVSLSTMLYYGLTDQDYFNRSSIDCALTDAMHFMSGIDTFGGDEEGKFGQYRDNNELWLKFKYSF